MTPGPQSHSLPPPRQLAICVRDANNDLVSAECKQLTGAFPDPSGRAFCHSLDQIRNAAYVSYGARCIAEAATLDALVGWIREVGFRATDFRIERLDVPGGLPSKQRLVLAVADAIYGRPNLEDPRQRLLLTVSERMLWFGEIVVETARTGTFPPQSSSTGQNPRA